MHARCLSSSCTPPSALHASFLAILPRLQRHGRIYFRGALPDRRADLVAEVVALAWKWFVRLADRGKDPTAFAATLAAFAAKAVKSGRRVTGQESDRDALSTLAQMRRCFVVSTLPEYSTLSGNPLAEALQDNTQSPVDEQAAFRLDFPAWLGTLGSRNRSIAQDMALGHRTRELADAYGLSPGRVSQLRREFHDDWEHFTADPGERAGKVGLA
jgi:hypothetical protein